MGERPEDHETIDEWIGDVACYSLGGNLEYCKMEPDIDGEWVKVSEVEAAILKKVRGDKEGRNDV